MSDHSEVERVAVAIYENHHGCMNMIEARHLARAAIASLSSPDTMEVERLREALARVRAALDFITPRQRDEIEQAVCADSELSLRACAKKHGVGVGVVRGIRARLARKEPGSG